MLKPNLGANLFTAALFAVGLAGIAAAWAAWPRTSSTSPLAALFALMWGCTCLTAAVLAARRSRFAAPVFCAAVAFLLFPARYLVPGSQTFLPSLVLIVPIAVFGFLYLHRRRQRPA
jgi:hypothetical protein